MSTPKIGDHAALADPRTQWENPQNQWSKGDKISDYTEEDLRYQWVGLLVRDNARTQIAALVANGVERDEAHRRVWRPELTLAQYREEKQREAATATAPSPEGGVRDVFNPKNWGV